MMKRVHGAIGGREQVGKPLCTLTVRISEALHVWCGLQAVLVDYVMCRTENAGNVFDTCHTFASHPRS